MSSRRSFIKSLSAAGAGALALRGEFPSIIHRADAAAFPSYPCEEDPWGQLPLILKRIKAPEFASREFFLTRFGAAGDGRTDCTAAFRNAIAACNRAGGGRVVVPPGVFLTGAIHFRSNVNLHLSAGATIKFSTLPEKYLPPVFTRWEGVEVMNYSPFVYAFGQRNIAITGEGSLDGQADCSNWWPWKGRRECGWKSGDPEQTKARKALFEMAERGIPVRRRLFGEGSYLRPNFIQPYGCRNVLIEGIKIVNSPMWEIHPVLCTNVTVRGVRIITGGPNNDGCNPESSRDVLIKDCYFDTGDDCIAIKSGRNADGRRLKTPSENIVIQGCVMKDGHGGVTIGSEISGGVHNVFAENCQMDSPRLERALRIKTNAMRGGTIENIFLRDSRVGQVSDSVVSIDFNYEEGAAGRFNPVVRRVMVRNLRSSRSKYALYLRGFVNAPITEVRLEDCSFENAALPNLIEHVQELELRRVRINGELIGDRN